MAKTREYSFDRHDPRAGRTNPTGPQGTAEQATWQSSQSGEAAVREASNKAADDRSRA